MDEPKTTPPDETEEGDKLPFTAHLEELRSRLIKSGLALIAGFAACYGFSDILFDFLILPLKQVLPEGSSLAMIRVQEGFLTHLKIALLAGLFVASPVLLYQAWKFVAPGLYSHEKRYVWPFVGAGTFFFLAGAAFAYWVVFPFGFRFLLAYAHGPVQASISIDAYLSFATRLLLAFGIVFQLPVVTFFLSRMGLVQAKTLSRARGYALLIIVIVAAMLTPPDVFTQILMALPLYLLYEISIVVARVSARPSQEAEETEEAAGAEEI